MWKIVNNLNYSANNNRIKIGAFFLVLIFLLTSFSQVKEDWGFFAHRRINRLAVFTLHPNLIGFYKKHIEYITAHATDPDMRRYVVPIEGQKHFIDMDHWYHYELPLDFRTVRQHFAEAIIINKNRDTLRLFGQNVRAEGDWNVVLKGNKLNTFLGKDSICLLYTSPSPRDATLSRMPSSA